MADFFPRTARALAAEGSLARPVGAGMAIAVLGAWGLWFFLAPVTLYRVSDQARLETAARVHPLAAAVAGTIMRTSLSLGRRVEAGEVLVELDPRTQELALAEERARLAALPAQLAALRAEIATEETALADARAAAAGSVAEARARLEHATKLAAINDDLAARFRALLETRAGSTVKYLRAELQAEQARAEADAARLELGRLQQDLKRQEEDRLAHIAALGEEAARLEGEQKRAAAAAVRLEQEIEKRRLRAPVGGRIAAVAPEMRIGAFVAEGERLGAIVPSQQTIAVAEFSPAAALGHIRPGQHARLRLAGFPWAQFGTIPVRVTHIAGEPRDGRIRVEFSVDAAAAPRIPFQNGLPGTIEVAVERSTPAVLVLRAAGRLLARPAVAAGD